MQQASGRVNPRTRREAEASLHLQGASIKLFNKDGGGPIHPAARLGKPFACNSGEGMKRIAFLLDYLYAATYQQEAVNGLVAALADTDDELYVFLGGPYGRDPYDPFVSSRNGVYDLITADMFDGIIVSNSVAAHLTTEEYLRFLDKYRGVPIVILGSAPPGVPLVAADNRSGMEGLVRHFIVDHGYRKIAFITGPDEQREAGERFEAYRRQLEAAGLPFDPQLVYHGDFNISSGMDAVRVLVDERRVPFDALIASNDFMALGAKLELEKRGVRIPAEVALAGFDDTMDASCIIPSLTTVRQPYVDMGKAALAALAARAAGEVAPVERFVPAEVVIRQSCGCLSTGADDPDAKYGGSAGPDGDAYYAEHRAAYVRLVGGLFTPAAPVSEIEFFLDAVHEEAARGTGPPVFQLIQPLLSHCISNRLSVALVQEALSLARRFSAPVLRTLEDVERLENFFNKARLSISEVQDVQKNQNLLFGIKQTDQLSEVSQALFSTVESSELANVIYRTFPLFNINNFLFADFPDAEKGSERARVIALVRGGKACRDAENAVFPARRLFPEAYPGFAVRVNFVLPVVYQEKELGFAVFEKIESGQALYAAPTGELSGGFYYEKIKGLQPLYLSLTRELSKSYYINRLISMRLAAEASLKVLTADLEFRNRELEDFAHIASHDLKEPLRKIVFFSDRLLGGIAGKSEADVFDHLERMRKAALRMNELIDGLLTYSRISSGGRPKQRVDLGSIVAEVIQDLEIRIGETKGRVEVGALPSLTADPLQMRELFQNLIGNALKYHRDGVPPVVAVDSERNGEFVEISVSDNGIGFEPDYREKIFGIFQRLVGKGEFEGTGVGLAICKKIVEKHNGTIIARGEPGRGATFTIRLPVAG